MYQQFTCKGKTMPLNWIDVEPLSFNCLVLLERAQIA